MKNLFSLLGASALALSLAACGLGNGSSASPPPWDSATGGATAGDGRVKLEWEPTSGVEYWLFMASDASLTAFNWINLPNSHAYINATAPYYVCGLYSGTTYYFATNGRIDGGPGGPSSPTISSVPYNASTAWQLNTTALADHIYGVGYTSLETCGSNSAISSTGMFAAVGSGGSVYTSTSNDGKAWDPVTSPVTSDLYAVTGYAANQNNPGDPGLRWVAVGAGGVSVYSLDGISWTTGRAEDLVNPNPALRSITQVAGTYFAVGDKGTNPGDTGTILSSTDGINWTTRSSGVTQSLNGIAHGAIYVAVGDNGTIITSVDGVTWTPVQSSPTTNNLRQVTAYTSIYGSIYVAVGDAGTVVVSKDGGATWDSATTPPATSNAALVGVTVESQFSYVSPLVADPLLGFITLAQFVAVDSNGNAYTSVNGYEWSPAIATGAANLNTLVSSGFGYVAAGNNGATAYAF